MAKGGRNKRDQDQMRKLQRQAEKKLQQNPPPAAPHSESNANRGQRGDTRHDESGPRNESNAPHGQRGHRPHPGNQRNAGRGPHGGSGGFVNPYTFVPTPDRDSAIRAHAFAGDYDPSLPELQEDHSRLWPGRYTGSIRMKLTATTPLFITDTEGVETAANGHKTYHCRREIPATSIKGMLRNVYEIVTNSRFGVFNKDQHKTPLALRHTTNFAINLVPGMIVSNPSAPEEISVELLCGETAPGQQRGRTLHAAWLPRYNCGSFAKDRGASSAALTYGSGELPAHQDRVRVKLQRRSHNQPNFNYYEVVSVWKSSDRGAPVANQANGIHDGVVCVTGPTVNKKHHERVFFHALPTSYKYPVSKALKERYQALIRNYREIHEREIEKRRPNSPEDYLGGEPGKTAWGPYVWDQNWEELESATKDKAGTLVYVEMRGATVVDMFPAMIPRGLHPATVWDSLSANLCPAKEPTALSPADRLFGWVNAKGKGAWRGKVRITDVRSPADCHFETFQTPLPLAILGAPKPSQVRFYLGDAHGSKEESGRSKTEFRYDGSRRIRGRKVYWRPNGTALKQEYWQRPWEDRIRRPSADGYAQEYRQLPGDDERTDQNRSIHGWYKQGAEIHFTLQVENLTSEELGALISMASLHHLEGFETACVRMGLGKPLGLGCLKLELDQLDEQAALAVAKGEDWKAMYSSLDAAPPQFVIDELEHQKTYWQATVESYRKANVTLPEDDKELCREWTNLPFIKAFLAAARGPQDGVAVHYPRTGRFRTDRQGTVVPSYKWFTDNERQNQHQPLAGLCLPDPRDTNQALPYRPQG